MRNQIEIGRADVAIFGEGRDAGLGAVAACSTPPSVLVDLRNAIIFVVESSGICAWVVRLTAFCIGFRQATQIYFPQATGNISRHYRSVVVRIKGILPRHLQNRIYKFI